jgi:hypothetical protein
MIGNIIMAALAFYVLLMAIFALFMAVAFRKIRRIKG